MSLLLAGLIEVPHGEVSVEPRGQGEPLLLVHGFGSDAEAWRATSLDEERLLVPVDTRGFGQSSRTPGDYSVHALAEDLVAVLDAQGIERTDVVAHSWGSSLALDLARNHPDRVDQIVLVGRWV